MRSKLTNIAVLLTSFTVGILALEGALGMLGYGSLYKSGVSRLFDPVLRYRLPPGYFPEIDERGYRNPSSEGPFDIVVLGDSHAYGYGVTIDESFPRRLESLTGKAVYSFGMGGFGPPQYAYLAPRALAMSPRLLVVAMFMGNDLADACNIAGILEYWGDYYRRNGLTSVGCRPKNTARSLEEQQERTLFRKFKSFVKGTRIGSILNHHIWLPLSSTLGFWINPEDSTVVLYVDDPVVRSIFPVWPNHTPRVDDGFVVTKYFLRQIIDVAQAQNVRVMILTIPSKQNLYMEHLQERGYRLPNGFVAAVEAERRQGDGIAVFARSLGAIVADPTPALRMAMTSPGPLYPFDNDSHPTAKGYDAYARAVLTAIREATVW
jgi:hypothetical protein